MKREVKSGQKKKEDAHNRTKLDAWRHAAPARFTAEVDDERREDVEGMARGGKGGEGGWMREARKKEASQKEEGDKALKKKKASKLQETEKKEGRIAKTTISTETHSKATKKSTTGNEEERKKRKKSAWALPLPRLYCDTRAHTHTMPCSSSQPALLQRVWTSKTKHNGEKKKEKAAQRKH